METRFMFISLTFMHKKNVLSNTDYGSPVKCGVGTNTISDARLV